jgi:hypothetical protein
MINNLKHSIWNFILSIIFSIVTCIGLIVLLNEKEWIWAIFFLLLLIAGICLFSVSLINIQWAIFYNDKIVVKNIFGIIKEIEYKDINKAFKANATIFSLKTLGIHRPYIVLSRYKSLQKSQIGDAYNRRKYKYLIIPFSTNVETMIKAKYKLTTGADLEIK